MRTAWIVVALLVPVALLNYLDRQMLAAMKFSVMEDIPSIGLEANWGKILALFKWVYAILSPIGGYLADRYSRRHVIAGSLAVWSAVTLATGQVTTYDQLLWTRAIALGEVSAVQPISFLQLPVLVVFGWWLFGETIDGWTLAGAAILLGANGYIAHREAMLLRRAATQAPV